MFLPLGSRDYSSDLISPTNPQAKGKHAITEAAETDLSVWSDKKEYSLLHVLVKGWVLDREHKLVKVPPAVSRIKVPIYSFLSLTPEGRSL